MNYRTKFLINNWKRLTDKELKGLCPYVNWFDLCQRENLTVEFVNKFEDRIVWVALSINRNIDEHVLIKYIDKLSIIDILYSNRLNEKLIMNNVDKFSKYIPEILKTQVLSKNTYDDLKLIWELLS